MPAENTGKPDTAHRFTTGSPDSKEICPRCGATVRQALFGMRCYAPIDQIRRYFAELEGRGPQPKDALAVGLMVRGFTADEVRAGMGLIPQRHLDENEGLNEMYLAAVDDFADVIGLRHYPFEEDDNE